MITEMAECPVTCLSASAALLKTCYMFVPQNVQTQNFHASGLPQGHIFSGYKRDTDTN